MLTFSCKKGQANRGYSIKLETDVNSQSKTLPLFLLLCCCNKNDLILCSLRRETCSLIPIFGRPCSATDARVTFTPQARSPEFSSPIITLAITHAATSKAASSFHLEPGQVLKSIISILLHRRQDSTAEVLRCVSGILTMQVEATELPQPPSGSQEGFPAA